MRTKKPFSKKVINHWSTSMSLHFKGEERKMPYYSQLAPEIKGTSVIIRGEFFKMTPQQYDDYVFLRGQMGDVRLTFTVKGYSYGIIWLWIEGYDFNSLWTPFSIHMYKADSMEIETNFSLPKCDTCGTVYEPSACHGFNCPNCNKFTPE